MKKLLFLIAIPLTFAFTLVMDSAQVLITPNSRLLINGKTNVNSFACKFAIPKIKNPISVRFKRVDDKMVFDNTILVLKTNCFDCGGKVINKDFNELLKSESHPETHIRLKEIIRKSNTEADVLAFVDITLAGVTNSYSLPVILNGTKQLSVLGLLNLNICDFNLEPPKKAMGLIVVDEHIQINFQLIVEEY